MLSVLCVLLVVGVFAVELRSPLGSTSSSTSLTAQEGWRRETSILSDSAPPELGNVEAEAVKFLQQISQQMVTSLEGRLTSFNSREQLEKLQSGASFIIRDLEQLKEFPHQSHVLLCSELRTFIAGNGFPNHIHNVSNWIPLYDLAKNLDTYNVKGLFEKNKNDWMQQFKELEILTKKALKTDVRCNLDQDSNKTAVARGNYIFLSDLKNKCDLPKAEVFVVEATFATVFDEAGLFASRDNAINLVVIAPKWIVTQEYLTLSGRNGTGYTNKEGTNERGDGKNGANGTHGGHGGDFLGYGMDYEGKCLTITSQGGDGGRGQDGGDTVFCNNNITFHLPAPGIGPEDLNHYGGNGGGGGNSGRHGEVTTSLKSMGTCPKLNVVTKNGKPGSSGLGGNGHINVPTTCRVNGKLIPRERRNFGSSGKSGIVRQDGKPASMPHQTAVLHYKKFLLDSWPQPKYLNSFLAHMSSDPTNSFTILGLYEELLYLESQATRLRSISPEDLIEYYKAFMNQVKTFPWNNWNSKDIFDSAIATLQATIYMRIHELTMYKQEIGLVTDLQAFLQITTENLASIKDSKTSLEKFQIVEHARGKLESSIQEKQDEAEKLIREEINPEIERNQELINTYVDQLLTEIAELRSKEASHKEELESKKKKLQKWRRTRQFFRGFKFLGKIASVFGPKGAVVGAVFNLVGGIGEGSGGDIGGSDPGNGLPPIYTSRFQDFSKGFSMSTQAAITRRKAELNEISKYLNDPELHDLQQKLENTRSKLETQQKLANTSAISGESKDLNNLVL